MFEIYKITNEVTGLSYIGQTRKTTEYRFKQHTAAAMRGEEWPICRAIRKYGADAFSTIILEKYGTKEEEANSAEIRLIEEHGTLTNGYNAAAGGQGGCIALYPENPKYDEICKKLSKSQKKKSDFYREKALAQYREHGSIRPKDYVYGEGSRKKISVAHKGKVVSKESNEKRLASLKETFSKEGYIHPNKGRPRSEKTKKLVSENHADVSGDRNPMYGKKHSEETRRKISEAAKRRRKKTHDGNSME